MRSRITKVLLTTGLLMTGIVAPFADILPFAGTSEPTQYHEIVHAPIVSVDSNTVRPAEWAAYKAHFVTPDGRVIDRENYGISHSEGQAYGMLIALDAGDRQTFERIWNFTRTRMQGRGDRLTSWLYDPRQTPPVADTNNATDGDVLIAYALLKAAVRWNDLGHLRTATAIIREIGDQLLARRNGHVIVRPGAFGFENRTEGPVVNLSYYIYGAFLAFAQVDDTNPWLKAWQSGLVLTEATQKHNAGATPDWITLKRARYLKTASTYAPRASYDSVRIPLYMMMAGRVPTRYIAPFDTLWNVNGSGAPRDIHLMGGAADTEMRDPGYRAIAALAACASRGVPMPADTQRFRPTTYFASSLHLLALSAARTHLAHCLGEPERALMVADLGANAAQR